MKIEVYLYASLSQYLPPEEVGPSTAVEIRDATRVREVLLKLKIPHDAVKLIFLNGTHADMDAALEDGDRLGLFPAVGGG